MNCCCCFQSQNINSEAPVNGIDENVEDGDILQEIGNAQYTLDFLRQVVQQSTITHDESPPPYEDFNKYPKLSKSGSITNSCPIKACTQQPQQCPHVDFENFVNSSAPLDTHGVTWVEPYPKPHGEPPPTIFNWLRSRFGSFRQSIVSRLSTRSSHLMHSSPSSSHIHTVTPNFVASTDVNNTPRIDQSEPSQSMSTTVSSAISAHMLSTPNVSDDISTSSSSISTVSSVTHINDHQKVIESSTCIPNTYNFETSHSNDNSIPCRILIVHRLNTEQSNLHQTNSQGDSGNSLDEEVDHSMTQSCTDSYRLQNFIVLKQDNEEE
ncbi:unnamed protein product [Heterobilharzia americana]|nr:unnamed protein product [Heterobilharzia americana]CAH8459447.1 unnamed protein product [Heterobilharzia americana]